MKLDQIPLWTIYIVLVWQVLWSGLALWRSAKLNQNKWFIGLFISFLFIHTIGIIEIVYLFYFAKKRLTIKDIKTWFRNTFFTKVK